MVTCCGARDCKRWRIVGRFGVCCSGLKGMSYRRWCIVDSSSVCGSGL